MDELEGVKVDRYALQVDPTHAAHVVRVISPVGAMHLLLFEVLALPPDEMVAEVCRLVDLAAGMCVLGAPLRRLQIPGGYRALWYPWDERAVVLIETIDPEGPSSDIGVAFNPAVYERGGECERAAVHALIASVQETRADVRRAAGEG